MKSLKKALASTFVALLICGCVAPSVATARTVGDFYFYMTNDNETDQTGLFNTTSPVWISKATSNTPAAIRCDTYTNSTYNYKSTLNYSNPIRATTFEWLNTGVRVEPTYLSGYGVAGQTYKIWARRDDRETSSYTTASGTWSPDNA